MPGRSLQECLHKLSIHLMEAGGAISLLAEILYENTGSTDEKSKK